MNNKSKFIVSILILIDILVALWFLLHNISIPVLNPSGIVATKERDLIVITTILMLIIVIPVFALTIFIAYKYRENNVKAKYTPDWDHNSKLEFLWWVIPCIIIFVLSIFVWQSSHDLDPYKSLQSTAKPIVIQVVSLDWKWLFIYPEQHIASVNMIEFPENVPVTFYITSDSVMNSFWVPSLGGQIYAMPGMITQLHLMANKTGDFYGSPANISGKGFSRMTFTVKSVSQNTFDQWVQSIKKSSKQLTFNTYNELSKPSEDTPVTYYSLVQNNLYDTIIMKFTAPISQITQMQGMNSTKTTY